MVISRQLSCRVPREGLVSTLPCCRHSDGCSVACCDEIPCYHRSHEKDTLFHSLLAITTYEGELRHANGCHRRVRHPGSVAHLGPYHVRSNPNTTNSEPVRSSRKSAFTTAFLFPYHGEPVILFNLLDKDNEVAACSLDLRFATVEKPCFIGRLPLQGYKGRSVGFVTLRLQLRSSCISKPAVYEYTTSVLLDSCGSQSRIGITTQKGCTLMSRHKAVTQGPRSNQSFSNSTQMSSRTCNNSGSSVQRPKMGSTEYITQERKLRYTSGGAFTSCCGACGPEKQQCSKQSYASSASGNESWCFVESEGSSFCPASKHLPKEHQPRHDVLSSTSFESLLTSYDDPAPVYRGGQWLPAPQFPFGTLVLTLHCAQGIFVNPDPTSLCGKMFCLIRAGDIEVQAPAQPSEYDAESTVDFEITALFPYTGYRSVRFLVGQSIDKEDDALTETSIDQVVGVGKLKLRELLGEVSVQQHTPERNPDPPLRSFLVSVPLFEVISGVCKVGELVISIKLLQEALVPDGCPTVLTADRNGSPRLSRDGMSTRASGSRTIEDLDASSSEVKFHLSKQRCSS